MPQPRDPVRPLGAIVESEARRLLNEAQLRADPALTAEGWERRFIADAARATEVAELYRAMGLEVRVEPVRALELGEDCESCELVAQLAFKTIYTRKPRTP